MDPQVSFAVRHVYALLFVGTLVEQLGVPLPATPLLLGAGALAQAGHAHLAVLILLAVVAASTSHVTWFVAGRLRGSAVLKLVCRISLEPDTCVRRTQNLFGRYGPRLLLASPFIPGLGMVAPPLAGLAGMRLWTFMLVDAAGSLIWASVLLGGGYLLGPQLSVAFDLLRRIGGSVASGVLILALGWVSWKLLDRRRVMRDLRMARITAHELKSLIDAGERVFVVDLRHASEIDADPRTLPGALWFGLDELEARNGEIPRDRDVALFCS